MLEVIKTFDEAHGVLFADGSSYILEIYRHLLDKTSDHLTGSNVSGHVTKSLMIQSRPRKQNTGLIYR